MIYIILKLYKVVINTRLHLMFKARLTNCSPSNYLNLDDTLHVVWGYLIVLTHLSTSCLLVKFDLLLQDFHHVQL